MSENVNKKNLYKLTKNELVDLYSDLMNAYQFVCSELNQRHSILSKYVPDKENIIRDYLRTLDKEQVINLYLQARFDNMFNK